MLAPGDAATAEGLQLDDLGGVVLSVGQHGLALLLVDHVELAVALVDCFVGEVLVVGVLRAI